ncbi:MAG: DUF6498-containing protein [Woeseiaceae bacterium]
MKIRLSSVALVLANLVPLAGVVFFGWRVFDVLMLYWLENVLIGIINVMRMAVTRDSGKWFLMPFFSVHYGAFCYGHLLAVTGLFSESLGAANVWEYFLGVPMSGSGPATSLTPQWIAVASIAASHLISYFVNFIGTGEYLRTTANKLMFRAYGRIVVLHVAIIGGAALIEWLGSPVSMLVVLVAAKIALDLRYHLAEREGFKLPAATP